MIRFVVLLYGLLVTILFCALGIGMVVHFRG
jgi:hypothetical protein